MPHYVLAFALGFGSGAAMIPYSIIKEVNPDKVKGSATGARNFIVFIISALASPVIGWYLQKARRRWLAEIVCIYPWRLCTYRFDSGSSGVGGIPPGNWLCGTKNLNVDWRKI